MKKEPHRQQSMSQKTLNSGSSHDKFLWTGVALIVLASGVLYWLQHSGQLSGGAIAPSKLAWLTTVIIFWYVLPAYWLLRNKNDQKIQLACGIFLASMLLRAAVELGMMYISNNWLHVYGICHDIFSVILCIFLALTLSEINRKIARYFYFCAGLFIMETGFAYYLKQASGGDGTVFFLEFSPRHSLVLWLTRLTVLASIFMFFHLIRSNQRAAA